MSLGMPSSVISCPIRKSSEGCSNADYEIIAVRRLGCHFYESYKRSSVDVKDHGAKKQV